MSYFCDSFCLSDSKWQIYSSQEPVKKNKNKIFNFYKYFKYTKYTLLLWMLLTTLIMSIW